MTVGQILLQLHATQHFGTEGRTRGNLGGIKNNKFLLLLAEEGIFACY